MNATPLRTRGLVRRFALLSTCVAALCAGCDDSAPPFDPDAPREIADVEGSWRVQVPRTIACLPHREPFALHLDLQHSHLATYLGEDDEEYFVGSWFVEPEGPSFTLQGWVDLRARRFRILLWQGTHEKGTVFRGRFLAGGQLSATLSEPVPAGDRWAADPNVGYPGGFSVGSCEWRVEGARITS